jgi:hypothetical protein
MFVSPGDIAALTAIAFESGDDGGHFTMHGLGDLGFVETLPIETAD